MFTRVHGLETDGTNLTAKILLVVHGKNPRRVEHAVQNPKVEVLETVQGVLGLVGGHAHPRLDVDIVVVTLDIGVGVVNKVMLGVPHIGTATHHTQRVGRHAVDPGYHGHRHASH